MIEEGEEGMGRLNKCRQAPNRVARVLLAVLDDQRSESGAFGVRRWEQTPLYRPP